MSCAFSQNTIKVPEGNSWQMLLPLKTAKWRGDRLVTDTIDYRALEDIAVLIDGVEYDDWQMTEDGPLVNMPAGQFEKGPHNTVLTALYFGVEVKASYFENFTIVAWSFESNVGEHLQESPLISDPAYIYVGITDDQELEDLKQQYREATAACETARLQYEAAKEEFDEKAEQLDDVAQQTTLVHSAATILEAIAGIHVDIPDNIATKDDVTAAKQAILDALSHISPTDPNSLALAQFFGLPEALPEIEVATEQEVKDINDDVMGALYGYGKVAVTIHSLMRTGAETTQDLASVIYVDPEKTWAENGYPTLYDDDGEPIDTTTNPAAGDEVFNYQIQSES